MPTQPHRQLDRDFFCLQCRVRAPQHSPEQLSVQNERVKVVANGKVTKLVAVFDEAGLLRQIGIIPSN